jgi:hypothetical protein
MDKTILDFESLILSSRLITYNPTLRIKIVFMGRGKRNGYCKNLL